MKKQLMLVAISCLFFLTAPAQKAFQGSIKFKITVEGVTDPNVLAQIPDNVEKIVFGNKSKTIGPTTSIIDGDYKVSYMIFEIPGMGKYYVKTTQKDMEKKFSQYKYSYDYTEEYITILDYKCQKVNITKVNLEDDSETHETVWVTKDPTFSDACNFAEDPGLVGAPLKEERRQELDSGDIMIVKIEAVELIPNKKLKATEFYLPSDAKNAMEDKELQKMFKQEENE